MNTAINILKYAAGVAVIGAVGLIVGVAAAFQPWELGL